MSYSPEQLRECAAYLAGNGSVWTLPEKMPKPSDVFRAHADALEELAKMREAVELLYDKWESGEDCHEVDGEDMGAFLGKAFRLSEEEEDAILALLKGVPTPAPMRIVMQRAERAEAELAEARNTTVPGSAAIYARLEQRLAESERKIERLKFHAEGMWLDLKTIAHEEQYALAKSAADYRADKDAK